MAIQRDLSIGERFELLLANLTDYAIFFLDADGTILTWHPGVRAVLGYEASDFIGRPLGLIYTDEDKRAGCDTRDLELAAQQGRSGNDTWHLHKDGSRVYVFGLLAALRTADGELRGFAKIIRDRTDHLESVELLQRERQRADLANREKDAFMAVLSHELHGPMNAIRGWAHIAIDGIIPPDQIPSALHRIARSSNTVMRLIEDLRDASRIVTGKLQLQFERVDLLGVVNHAAAELEATIEAKEMTFRIEPNGRPVVLGDHARLAQVVSNLLSNALKYTPAGGCITVRVEKADGNARLVVADTGRGIDPGQLPFIFQRFRRTDDAEERESGLGLGLWVTCELVRAHNGSISAASDGVGTGATFTVTLPLA